MTIKLRPWQTEALQKSMKWLIDDRQDRHFLINAAPGAGKTIASCVIAETLIQKDEIDRVVVIAPRTEVVNQWARDYRLVTGRHMAKVTGQDGDLTTLNVDVCATWAAVQNLSTSMQTVCEQNRTLVICDEHHHAAVQAAWGSGADDAFATAKFVLILTGTPIRSDGEHSVWLAYDNYGRIDHPVGGTYTLTYGQAVDLGYCRPITFHRHQGEFSVDLADGVKIQISGDQAAVITGRLARIPALQRALGFYRLATTPLYEADGQTPLLTGYQASMVEWGNQKLVELRDRMPDAGGLVIAPSIEMAEYMSDLIERIDGEKPMLVHSNVSNADGKIDAFRNTDKKWLVSVAMVSEGIDIQRLRVLLYLPSAQTELAFRQAVGRVVRTRGYDDDTRAYAIIPAFSTFEEYARRIENEMSATARAQPGAPRTRRCPVCNAECGLRAKTCHGCGHEFPERAIPTKVCDDCQTVNPMTAVACRACGSSFTPSFVLTLDEALRTGAIARGMDINEDEVQESEKISSEVRARILQSGDESLLRLIRTLPDESFGRLKTILNA